MTGIRFGEGLFGKGGSIDFVDDIQPTQQFKFNLAGEVFYYGDGSGNAEAYRTSDGELLWDNNSTFSDFIIQAAYSKKHGSVVFSDDGYLLASFDGENGSVNWTADYSGFGSKKFIQLQVFDNQKKGDVLITRGATLRDIAAIDITNGDLLWEIQDVISDPNDVNDSITGITADNESAFVISDDGEMAKINISDQAVEYRITRFIDENDDQRSGIYQSPTGDFFYAHTAAGEVRQLNKSDGVDNWTYSTGGFERIIFPRISIDESAFYTSFNTRVARLDPSDGSLIFDNDIFTAGDEYSVESATIDPKGDFYYASGLGGTIKSIDSNGNEVWSIPGPGFQERSGMDIGDGTPEFSIIELNTIQFNQERTGNTPIPGPTQEPSVDKTKQLGASSIVTGPGNIYVSDGIEILKLDIDLNELDSFSFAAIGNTLYFQDGFLYGAEQDTFAGETTVYKLDADDGSQEWSTTINGTNPSPILVDKPSDPESHAYIIIGSAGETKALDKNTGSVQWTNSSLNASTNDAPMAKSDTLYIGFTSDSKTFGIRKSDGGEIFQTETISGQIIDAGTELDSLPIDISKNRFFHQRDNPGGPSFALGYNADTGDEEFKNEESNNENVGRGHPAITDDSFIYVFERNGSDAVIRSVDTSTGNENWENTFSINGFRGGDVIIADGVGYASIPSEDGIQSSGNSNMLYSFDPSNGTENWRTSLTSNDTEIIDNGLLPLNGSLLVDYIDNDVSSRFLAIVK